MKPTRSHVKIDGIEFLLDESVERHYVRRWVSPVVKGGDIIGNPNKRHLEDNRILWSMTDWSGGEGANIFYEEDPTSYYISNGVNGRVRGQATVRPKRTRSTVTSNDGDKGVLLTAGDRLLWAGYDDRIAKSSDAGDSWTAATAAETGLSTIHADHFITAITGDERFVYYAGYRTSGSGNRVILRNSNAFSATTVEAEAADTAPYAALTIMGGMMYAWTGRKLFEMDVYGTLPLTAAAGEIRKVHDTGLSPPTTHILGAQWHADSVAGDSDVFYFFATEGVSQVYRYSRQKGARPFFKAPMGFTVKSISYQMGVLFVFGHWGGTQTGDNGRGGGYAIPTDGGRPIDLGYFREFTEGHLHMQRAVQSYGGQLLCAAVESGRIFIYDMNFDGFSMLDHLKDAPAGGDSIDFDQDNTNGEKIGDLITYGPHRIAAIHSQGTGGDTIQFAVYKDDRPTNRETDGSITDSTYINQMESSKSDLGFPLNFKKLIGFHVLFEVEDSATTSGLLANQRIVIKYALDDPSVTPTYTSLTTITSATTPTGIKGRVFIPVSDPTTTGKFYDVRVAFTVDNNSTDGVKPPIVKNITLEAELAEHIREWDLAIRVKDERDQTRRPGSQTTGTNIRDRLVTIIENHDVVEFVDRYQSKDLTNVNTFNVTVREPEDDIMLQGEGTMRLTLRALPVTT